MTQETHVRRQRTDDRALNDDPVQRPGKRSVARLARDAGRMSATVLLAAFLLSSCNFLGGSKSKAYDYSGTWRGSVNDATNGAGTFAATLDQAGYALSGTWHSVMADDVARQNGGAWTGQVYTGDSGDLLEVTLASAASGQCSYKLTLSRQQDAISGEYAPTGSATTCVNLDRGTIQLSRP